MKRIKYFLLIFISTLLYITLYSQSFYDTENISKIELLFEDENWEETLSRFHSKGNEQRLLATITINGQKLDSVGVRFKGYSTYSFKDKKKPLNIKLNYKNKQDYQGFKKIKLANGKHDPSFVREVLSYEIARKYMVAPMSNYAQVFVNGEYYGLFSNSESVDGNFAERHLNSSSENCRIKGNSDIFGDKGESSLVYYGPDSTQYMDRYFIKSDFGWNELVDFTRILCNYPNKIESVLNVDQALWMLAFNNIAINLDSYSGRKGNYYLLKDDNGLFNIILWDLNMSMGAYETIGGGFPDPTKLIKLVELNLLQEAENSSYPLINKLLEDEVYKRMYLAHCRTIFEENFENDWYINRAEELQVLIADAYKSDNGIFYTYNSFKNNLNVTVEDTISDQTRSKTCYGITELFDPRINFLQQNPEFNKQQPQISLITTFPQEVKEFSKAIINAQISNAEDVYFYYRHLPSEKFEKLRMYDDGMHNDHDAGDGIFGVEINTRKTDIQYYFYAENEEAGLFSPQRAQHEFFILKLKQKQSKVIINEFMADNQSVIADVDGEYDDWIELYNTTNKTQKLEGWFISDDANNITKWVFPKVSIKPKAYLILWADKDDLQSGLHTNFKLSKNGESLLLFDKKGNMVDHVVFGPQETDKSMGRLKNGNGDFIKLTPSFNAENFVGTSD